MDFRSKYFKNIFKTGKDFHVDIPKAKRLQNEVLPFSFPEEIENQNRKNARMVIIAKTYYSKDKRHNNRYSGNQESFRKIFVLRLFIYPHKTYSDQESPENVLVQGVKNPASHNKIKRNFAYQSKDEHSRCVFFKIFGVEKSFRNHKRKNRKRNSSDIRKPVVSRNDCCPKMVAKHKRHRHDMKTK